MLDTWFRECGLGDEEPADSPARLRALRLMGVQGALTDCRKSTQEVAGLAEAILKLLRDPALRERMGKAGRAMVLEEFSPRGLASKCAALYGRLVAERKNSGFRIQNSE